MVDRKDHLQKLKIGEILLGEALKGHGTQKVNGFGLWGPLPLHSQQKRTDPPNVSLPPPLPTSFPVEHILFFELRPSQILFLKFKCAWGTHSRIYPLLDGL